MFFTRSSIITITRTKVIIRNKISLEKSGLRRMDDGLIGIGGQRRIEMKGGGDLFDEGLESAIVGNGLRAGRVSGHNADLVSLAGLEVDALMVDLPGAGHLGDGEGAGHGGGNPDDVGAGGLVLEGSLAGDALDVAVEPVLGEGLQDAVEQGEVGVGVADLERAEPGEHLPEALHGD